MIFVPFKEVEHYGQVTKRVVATNRQATKWFAEPVNHSKPRTIHLNQQS